MNLNAHKWETVNSVHVYTVEYNVVIKKKRQTFKSFFKILLCQSPYVPISTNIA